MKTLISRRFATTVGAACLAMLAVGCAAPATRAPASPPPPTSAPTATGGGGYGY